MLVQSRYEELHSQKFPTVEIERSIRELRILFKVQSLSPVIPQLTYIARLRLSPRTDKELPVLRGRWSFFGELSYSLSYLSFEATVPRIDVGFSPGIFCSELEVSCFFLGAKNAYGKLGEQKIQGQRKPSKNAVLERLKAETFPKLNRVWQKSFGSKNS